MKALILVFLSSILLACGSDSKNDNADLISEVVPDNLGTIDDFKISGLQYQSGELKSYTNESGQFGYQNGEMIQFYVGNIPIGSKIEPNETLSVADLSNHNPSLTINITRFLLSLDDDNNAENGVNIELSINQQAVNFSLDFTSQAWDLIKFGSTEIQDLLNSITSKTTTGNRELVSSSDAYAQLTSPLNESLNELKEQITSELNTSECETNNQCHFQMIPSSYIGFCAPPPEIHVYSETTTDIDAVQLLSAQRNTILETKSNLHASADLPILGGVCISNQTPQYPVCNQSNRCEVSDEFPIIVIE